MTGVAAPSTQALIAQAASGDEVAFARIVAEHHEDMRRVCAVICGDDALAEDAVQAAWPIAWRKLRSVRDPERLRPWLVSVAVNEVKQLVRKHRRRTLIEGAAGNRMVAVSQDPAVGIELLDLRAAMQRLDPDDRALLAMRYVAGFNASELSIALGISPSGTRNRLERLLARLREKLSHE